VIQAAPVAIIDCGLDDIVRMWNPAAERIFGWKEAEVLGKPLGIVPGALEGEARAQREGSRAGEIVWIEDTQRQHSDGHLIDASVTLAPVYDAEGRVSGTMSTVIDISRRKQAEAALRESEAQLRLAMDAAQLGMWYWECDTDRFTYSGGLNALFGRPRKAPSSTTACSRSACTPRTASCSTPRCAMRSSRARISRSTFAWCGPTDRCTGWPIAGRCIAVPTDTRSG